MNIVAVVPKKDTATGANVEALFRIVFTIFKCVGAVYKEKRRLPCLVKIPSRRLSEVLFDLVAGRLTLNSLPTTQRSMR